MSHYRELSWLLTVQHDAAVDWCSNAHQDAGLACDRAIRDANRLVVARSGWLLPEPGYHLV